MENNKKQQQNYTRPNNTKACQPTDRKSSTDTQLTKPWPRNSNSRRREQTSTGPRNTKQTVNKGRPNVDKRPRPRGTLANNGSSSCSTYGPNNDVCFAGTGLAEIEPAAYAGDVITNVVARKAAFVDYELNSVYAPGSKKQNLNHLLNFHYAPRESENSSGFNVFGRNANMHHHQRYNQNHSGGGAIGRKHKYNKEQFMQANFQFVIKSCAKPKFNASPDTLIDWDLIEQINIQTTEEPQCPICLYPPIAAKLTRCGHAYCWPCILHYLALSDKTWRKCPICYEAIHTADLKSTTIMQQRQFSVNEEISFQLMRRKKGSMFIEKFTNAADEDAAVAANDYYPFVASTDDMKPFSKFLIAKRYDILDIIERERRELTIEEDDTNCPEFVFVQQALDLLNERREKLAKNFDNKKELFEHNENDADVENREAKDDDNGEVMNEHVDDIHKNERAHFMDETHNVSTADVIPEENVVAETEVQPTTHIFSDTDSKKTELNAPTTTKYYYFYQSMDGQNIFLHPLNVKMLQACYGTLDRAPLIITASILQQEHHSMDEENRRKFTCLGHLPLTCQYAVVEVDLQPPFVSESILQLFKNDIQFRRKERQRREREERKREKQIDEINDRQMGKLISSTANLNLTSSHEFPTCGFQDYLDVHAANCSSFASAEMAKPKTQQTSYSAVIGDSPKFEEWPSMPSASASMRSNNSYQELSTWGKIAAAGGSNNTAAASSKQRTISELSNDSNDSNVLQSPKCTNLSDVLAEAISQKKQHHNNALNYAAVTVPLTAAGGGGASKKNKKAKKMVPLFSTGINYNGN